MLTGAPNYEGPLALVDTRPQMIFNLVAHQYFLVGLWPTRAGQTSDSDNPSSSYSKNQSGDRQVSN